MTVYIRKRDKTKWELDDVQPYKPDRWRLKSRQSPTNCPETKVVSDDDLKDDFTRDDSV